MVTHNRLRWPATKAFCLNLRAYCQLRSLRPYITVLFGLTSTAAHLCGALVINIHQEDQRLPATPLLWPAKMSPSPVPTTPAWHHFIIYMWKLRHSLCPNDLQISFSESDLRLGPLLSFHASTPAAELNSKPSTTTRSPISQKTQRK